MPPAGRSVAADRARDSRSSPVVVAAAVAGVTLRGSGAAAGGRLRSGAASLAAAATAARAVTCILKRPDSNRRVIVERYLEGSRKGEILYESSDNRSM